MMSDVPPTSYLDTQFPSQYYFNRLVLSEDVAISANDIQWEFQDPEMELR